MKTWNDCVAFHGHACGGLTIGYKASLLAAKLLAADFSPDEQLCCIAENDACGVDAIQVMLGCSVGKGNLQICIRGKQAYSFYNRRTGKAVRLVLKEPPAGMTKEASFSYYQSQPEEELFYIKTVTRPVPEKAQLFGSRRCSRCGELTGEKWLCARAGQWLCLDCLEEK